MIKFIIDTDSYSGNFEREMCAYATGHLRDCGIGSELVKDEIKQKFVFHIDKIKDERECMTPVEISTTPGFGNNGLGFNGDGSPESYKKAKEAYIEYVIQEDLKKAIQRVEFYKNTKADNSRNISELKRIEEEIEALKKRPENTFLPYPAYQSVCIFFKTLPDDLIELMKIRCTEYAKKNKIKILDFRVITPETIVKQETSTEKKESNSIKVKITAYEHIIIIETINPNESDKDFRPNSGSNIGCSLSNLNRLGISLEAIELLEHIKRSQDAIGDIMWDGQSFSWLGGPLSLKDSTHSEGDRSYTVGDKYEMIPNEVSQEIIDIIKQSEKIKEIDYNDVEHEIWFTLEKRNWDKTKNFHVSTNIIDTKIYDNKVVVINSSEKHTLKGDDGYTTVRILDETKTAIKEFSDKIFGTEMTILDEHHMDIINRLFEIGAWNNVMDPREDYYRMAFKGKQKELLDKFS